MGMAGHLFHQLFLVTVVLIPYAHLAKAPRVQTKLGSVVGTAKKTDDGQMIYSFKGIPYIKPPVGELRFKPPQPAEPWTGDFSATTEPTCVQIFFSKKRGVEDCITLNIHTPWDPSSNPPKKPLSVMVYITGGAFIGHVQVGEPDYLLQHHVVLVSIKYRVGALGFLSTWDKAATGNYGMLDQVEALKWIKNNIASFGGNPNDVTVFGESAGGISVQLLMMSPLAKGLFHRGIAQSGTSIMPMIITRTARSSAQALARKLDCPEEPSEKLLECLRGKDAEEIANADIVDPEKRLGLMPLVWLPRVDSEATDPFLPKYPIDLLSSGEFQKLPLLMGHGRNEGHMFTIHINQYYDSNDRYSTVPDLYCKYYLGMKTYLLPENVASEMCIKAEKEYNIKRNLKGGFKEHFKAYTELVGDGIFASPNYKSSELISKHSPVYNYIFNYESKDACFEKVFYPENKKPEGVVDHIDDVLYLFKYPQFIWTKESPEYKMAAKMSKIWTDFAKTGKPSLAELNSSWPKASWPDHSYVVIDTESSIQQNYKPEKMKTLDEIYSRYLYKTRVDKTMENKREEVGSDIKDEL